MSRKTPHTDLFAINLAASEAISHDYKADQLVRFCRVLELELQDAEELYRLCRVCNKQQSREILSLQEKLEAAQGDAETLRSVLRLIEYRIEADGIFKDTWWYGDGCTMLDFIQSHTTKDTKGSQ